MFSLLQLKKIFQLGDNFFYWLKIIFLSIIIFGLILSLWVSPKDYLQGETVRIMYVHVPASWLALMIFSAMGLFSIITLIFKILRAVPPPCARRLPPPAANERGMKKKKRGMN